MSSDGDIALGYNFLVVGSDDAGVRGVVSAYMEEPSTSDLSTSFLRANQKVVKLPDNRLLILDIIERPGGMFRECCGDLARSHGVLLVYNPASLASFQYAVRFHEQLTRSKWRTLPVVLFSMQRNLDSVHSTHGHAFSNVQAIPFIEASPGRPCQAPFPVLLGLVRQHYETSAPESIGEGVLDFLTVTAAKVTHVARSHMPALPLSPRGRRQPRNFAGNCSAPRPTPEFRQ